MGGWVGTVHWVHAGLGRVESGPVVVSVITTLSGFQAIGLYGDHDTGLVVVVVAMRTARVVAVVVAHVLVALVARVVVLMLVARIVVPVLVARVVVLALVAR